MVMDDIAKLKKLISEHYFLIGWQEWCSLPKLNIPLVKAKIDTGAKTSSIHAVDIETHKIRGKEFVEFTVHPIQRCLSISRRCRAAIVDRRQVMSSSGHKEKRYVIKTPIIVGEHRWDIELTLTDRESLQFRMLLGRAALRAQVIINPKRRMLQHKMSRDDAIEIYRAC